MKENHRGAEGITDAEVERQIARLLDDDDVILAKREQAVRYRRRQYLYKLRGLKKRGAELRESGISLEMLEDEDYGE